jgi:hypothetical protein
MFDSPNPPSQLVSQISHFLALFATVRPAFLSVLIGPPNHVPRRRFQFYQKVEAASGKYRALRFELQAPTVVVGPKTEMRDL